MKIHLMSQKNDHLSCCGLDMYENPCEPRMFEWKLCNATCKTCLNSREVKELSNNEIALQTLLSEFLDYCKSKSRCM
jgi:hypothetical protein